jgi:transglutaminase-like putative cysteine protease
MKFKVFCELEYNVRFPSTFIFDIHALRTKNQTILEETVSITPFIQTEEFTSSHSENRFFRMVVKKKSLVKVSYQAIVDNNCQIIHLNEHHTVPVGQLDGDVLPYLFPSRYCQSDKLFRLAHDKFGRIKNMYTKVVAITNWIHKNVEYLSGSTTSQTSAFDTVTERAGVCRDFAHLGIALCRALSIPARYFTGYAYQLYPPDFHACFEAYIGGHWILFDATKLVPINGLVKIATGRDAADAAVASTFGIVECRYIHVGCELIDEGFVPFVYNPSEMKGISY